VVELHNLGPTGKVLLWSFLFMPLVFDFSGATFVLMFIFPQCSALRFTGGKISRVSGLVGEFFLQTLSLD